MRGKKRMMRLPGCLLLAALLLAGAVFAEGCHGEEGTGSHNGHNGTSANPAAGQKTIPGAAAAAKGGITVENAWARPVTKEMSGMGMSSAAYFVIRNQGAEDALVGVSTDIGKAEMHETVPVEGGNGGTNANNTDQMNNHNHSSSGASDTMGTGGAMKMRPVNRVPIPAGGSVEFRPGGLHVMLKELKTGLPEGARFNLTLYFEKGGQKTIQVTARQP